MKKFRILIILCLAVGLAACQVNASDTIVGSGHLTSETRQVSDFSSLELTCSADVTLAQGPLAVSIEGDDNLLALIQTNVSGRKLTIQAKSNRSFRTTQPLIVHVVMPQVTAIQISGSGNVELNGLTATVLDLSISGSGSILLRNLTADTVTTAISGSGGIELEGRTGQLTVKDTASGDFTGEQLNTRQAVVTLSGSGDATVWVYQSLSVSLSGSGDLLYYGTPDLDQHATGSGRVEKLGDQP